MKAHHHRRTLFGGDQGSRLVFTEDADCIGAPEFLQGHPDCLLELAGFEVVAEYGDFKGSPPAYGREQVWVVRTLA